jgi:uncharacterized protein YjbI with pentapeptide repeats
MAVYYRGLTVEFDAHIPRLTVDGQQVPLPSATSERAVLSELQRASNDELIQHAQRYVDESPDFTKRDAIRDRHVRILKDGTTRWNQWRQEAPEIRPLLYEAELDRANLNGANLANANMIRARLRRARLVGANFHEANLGGADLSGAKLMRANFCRTDLYETTLSGANLESANLQGTQLARTDFAGAQLINCRIYGLSAWDLKVDKKTTQRDLIIVYDKQTEDPDGQRGEGHVIVDDLRVAQFIYLLLHNENIRDVIDTVSKKAVLILGRFTPKKRKDILDAIRNWLRNHDYVPILFDFEKSPRRHFDETVRVLAGICRFIIADITNPSSIPMELQAIVPEYRIPVVPIIEKGEKPFATFSALQEYRWVQKLVDYASETELLRKMDRQVVGRALKADQTFQATRTRTRER